jgi:hypothetical protein
MQIDCNVQQQIKRWALSRSVFRHQPFRNGIHKIATTEAHTPKSATSESVREGNTRSYNEGKRANRPESNHKHEES